MSVCDLTMANLNDAVYNGVDCLILHNQHANLSYKKIFKKYPDIRLLKNDEKTLKKEATALFKSILHFVIFTLDYKFCRQLPWPLGFTADDKAFKDKVTMFMQEKCPGFEAPKQISPLFNVTHSTKFKKLLLSFVKYALAQHMGKSKIKVPSKPKNVQERIEVKALTTNYLEEIYRLKAAEEERKLEVAKFQLEKQHHEEQCQERMEMLKTFFPEETWTVNATMEKNISKLEQVVYKKEIQIGEASKRIGRAKMEAKYRLNDDLKYLHKNFLEILICKKPTHEELEIRALYKMAVDFLQEDMDELDTETLSETSWDDVDPAAPESEVKDAEFSKLLDGIFSHHAHHNGNND